MIKQFFTQPKVLSRLQEGVFGPYLPVFAASLHEEGYSRGCIRRHLRAADHFGVWLTGRRLTVGDLTRATLDRYIEGGGRLYSASTPNGRLPHSAQGLHELLEFLESQGVIAPAVETPLTSAGKWLAEFDSHLDRTLGCAPRSRSNYLLYARRFLEECFGHAEIEWQKLSADAIVDFVRREAAKLQPISCGQPVTAMRAFLRFLTSTGVIPAGLTGAVPSVRTWRHSVLPRAVSADQAQSRNVRLAAVHSFFRMVAIRDPASVGVATRVLAIPVKRTDKRLLGYLTRKEMDALLEAHELSQWAGRRDHALLLTLYNTGARVSEITGLQRSQVQFGTKSFVQFKGKGRKERAVPLWSSTSRTLRTWFEELNSDARYRAATAFPNARGAALSRDGVAYILQQAVERGATTCPSLAKKRVTPHLIRHTSGMHLLQAGVDITVIALWLGHESTQTTHGYVEADLAMKEKALGKMASAGQKTKRFQADDELLRFLTSL